MVDLIHGTGRIVLTGLGATLAMDAWLLLLRRAGVKTLDFALVGRWAGHALRGRWQHEAIARATPIRAEGALGWSIHYGVGIAFAGLLVAIMGTGWLREPGLPSALGFGLGTVVVPLFIMQPAMGAGIASSNTPNPIANVVKSMATHAVFGAGLYFAAVATKMVGF